MSPLFIFLIIFCLSSYAISCDFTTCVYGLCQENICICNNCYITVKNLNELDLHTTCNYSQFSSLYAGLIETFFPIGFGHFYLRNISIGFTKMIMAYFMICGVYLVIYCYIFKRSRWFVSADNISDHQTALNPVKIGSIVIEDLRTIQIICFVSQGLFLLMHLLDLFLLYKGIYKDGNNISLC
jgi:hypothetical protein